MRELFNEALRLIENHSINPYFVGFNPGASIGTLVKIQGDLSENKNVLDKINFTYDPDERWYVAIIGNVEITITDD